MRNEVHHDRRARHDTSERSVFDVLLTVMGLWLIPVSLFGYIGYTVAVATGHDPFNFMPALTALHVAVIGVLMVLTVVGIFVVARNSKREKASRWDDYEEARQVR